MQFDFLEISSEKTNIRHKREFDMAKDKEKLFRGVDDKAITFQRAVFIVCNLKRLIKRPKKEDKQ